MIKMQLFNMIMIIISYISHISYKEDHFMKFGMFWNTDFEKNVFCAFYDVVQSVQI